MIFDIETDDLNATKIHVMAYTEGTAIKYTTSYQTMREVLSNAKVLIGHNIILFDVPVLEKLLGIDLSKKPTFDTLAMSWYLNHERNAHGLESYGVEYGLHKKEIDDWKTLAEKEYVERCVRDVEINKKLYNQLVDKLFSIYNDKEQAKKLVRYLSFKLSCVRLQHKSKWMLDKKLVKNSIKTLTKIVEEKKFELSSALPKTPIYAVKTPPAKPYKKDGTLSVTGASWKLLLKEQGLPSDHNQEVKYLVGYKEPNPGSVPQIKDWLFSLGWKPENFKYTVGVNGDEKKVPQIRVVNDGVKELCPSIIRLVDKNPDVALLDGLSVAEHRLSIFEGLLTSSEGTNYVIADIGGLTNTLRFKHRVLVNLPGVDKPWGKEIRGSLIAKEGNILCGSDVSSLEESTKKHYMYKYDPDFVNDMSKEGFDAHLDLAKHAGEVSQEAIDAYISKKEGYEYVGAIRKIFKAANYACVYGVGKVKLARETGLSVFEAGNLIVAYWKRNWAVKKLAEDTITKMVNGSMWLFNPVSKFWYSLRNEKDIFSTLNQGTGVYCFDTWLSFFLKKRAQLTAQFHDEVVLELKEGKEKECEDLLNWAMEKTNEKLKLNVQLRVDIKFGKNYAEVH